MITKLTKQNKVFARLTSLLIIISTVCFGLYDAGLVFVRDNADTAYDSVGIYDTDGDRIIALYGAADAQTVQKYGLEHIAADIYKATAENAARFYAERKQDIKYIENDCEHVISVNETLPDPAEKPYEYVSLKLGKAHELTKGKNSVVIAVLDTGVDRNDDAVKNALFTEGYDAATENAVTSDATGHGTAICSLIYTVAPDCVIMPIKVSRGTSTIYTSDLIKGLHYAADNGAKIINMSFGGYNYSYAEQEAVDYCVSKGCILIAAAGNDGMTSLADSPNYPAGYEGVIGVGSTGKDGIESEFSQEVGADVFAPGEMITIKSGENISAQNGTSFSAAFISGTAALCASICSECRFENAEFEFLISFSGETAPSTAKLVELSLYPAVTGVKDGGEYTSDVYIFFNRGEAYLDGETIDDGERVFLKGEHTLVVSHLGRTVTLGFKLTASGAEYEINKSGNVLNITFDGGEAYLDGEPYISGTDITSPGEHYFEIISNDITRSEIFTVDHGTAIYGVADNAVYMSPITAYIDGTALLDGEEVTGEIFIDAGDHKLKTAEREISFSVSDGRNIYAAMSGESVQGAGGIIASFNIGTGGITLFDISDPEKALRFISTPPVTDCVFAGDMLAVLDDSAITFYDIENGAALYSFDTRSQCTAVSRCGDGICALFGDTLCNILADGSVGTEIKLGKSYEGCALSCEGSTALIYDKNSDDGVVLICDINTGEMRTVDTHVSQLDKDIITCGNVFAVGHHVFSAIDGKMLFDADCGDILAAAGNAFICRNGAVDKTTGRALCKYKFDATWAAATDGNIIIRSSQNTVTVTDDPAFFYGGYALSDEICAAYDNALYFKNAVASSTVYNDELLLTFQNDRNIYALSYENGLRIIGIMPFVPDAIYTDGAFIYASFKNKALLVRFTEGGETEMISAPSTVSSMAFCGDRIFMLCDGVLTELMSDMQSVSHGYITASTIAAVENGLLAASRRNIKLFDASTLNEIYSLKCRVNISDIKTVSSFAAAGGVLFDIASGDIIKTYTGNAQSIISHYLLTDNGVYDCDTADIKPFSAYRSSAEDIYICKNSLVYVCGSHIRFCDAEALCLPEIVQGITDGGIYAENAEIEIKAGTAYLDGTPTENIISVSSGGSHTLTVVIRPGITLRYGFSVVPECTSMEFAKSDITLGTGENCVLDLLFLPFGAEALPVVFTSDNTSVLKVDAHGTAEAVSPGTATVTATAADGAFSCKCNITVLEDPIRFAPESGITVDRPSAVAYRIPLGTTVDELINAAGGRDGLIIVSPDGTNASGIIKTGMLMDFYRDGQLHDTLTLSAVGDIDGDGYSTYDDYILLSDMISSAYVSTPAQRYAADVNTDGVLSSADLLRLHSQLLFSRSFYGTSTPPTIDEGGLEIDAARHGDTVDVLISCKNMPKHLNGRLMFDSDTLEFLQIVAPYAEIEYKVTGKYVSFIAKPKSNIKESLILISFKSLSEDSLITLSDCVLTYDAAYSNPEVALSVPNPSAQISVVNALRDIKFDIRITEYNVTLPFGSISALISAPADAVINGALADGREQYDIAVSTGGRQYILHCHISDTVVAESNSLLASLEVGGEKLQPKFDPKTTEYAVVIDTDRALPEITAAALSPYASVEISYGADTAVITCTAEDGTSTSYIITFIRRDDTSTDVSSPDVSSPSETSRATEEEKSSLPQSVIISVLLIALAAIAAVAVAIIKKRTRKDV